MKKLLWNYKIAGLRNPSISDGIIIDNKLFVAVCYSEKRILRKYAISYPFGYAGCRYHSDTSAFDQKTC